ncbi:substrate-binding domain-containing protein [Novosphingobium rosa]|jgi:accessory colonization factor AcfC|uniref:substrate-binding domain-containing protein n=1 Tax=Novosphingobium rosa TaxID=76978 RepID=UPI00082DAF0D|nr:substrate-binding domain-containing protein [Novosphingobium rosa]
MKGLIITAIGALTMVGTASAETIHVYGPGGPAPAMKEAAAAFSKINGIEVIVTSGPTPQWSDALKTDGDVIYSGSEVMMSDFISSFTPLVNPATITVLYLRPAGILVRPGNPKHIRGFADLLKPGLRIAVVDGAGQQGLWEDIAGHNGDIAAVRAFRKNIALYAKNTALGLEGWKADPELDAWVTFPIWAKAHPGVADVVALDPARRLYRDAGVALTLRGQEKPDARGFVQFLAGPQGAAIFKKWGWE